MKIRYLTFFVLILIVPPAVWASWNDVQRSSNDLKLLEARQAVINNLNENPSSPDALASAVWWARNLENLQRPDEILNLVRNPVPAPLSFVLARIETDLDGAAPEGSPTEVEISGPWGLFGRLDLDRIQKTPELPPVGTSFKGPGTRFCYLLKSETAWVGTPSALSFGGASLVRWKLESSRNMKGWMVVEVRGNANFRVDGRQIDTFRDPGISGPGLIWYRAEFQAGYHLIEAQMAPQNESRIRLSFFEEDGRPFSWTENAVDRNTFSTSTLKRREPIKMEKPSTLEEALLQYELFGWLKDSTRQRKTIDTILRHWSADPRAHLAAAGFFLLERTGAGLSEDYRRAQQELEKCPNFPISTMFSYLLAQMQRRDEDADTLREKLISENDDDPRVLQLKIDEAIDRNWPGEAENALRELENIVGQSIQINDLRLRVLRSLDRWSERKSLLLNQARTTQARSSMVTELTDACCYDEAIEMMKKLGQRITNPNFDADEIRLLMSAGRRDAARQALRDALSVWGFLPVFQDLGLMVEEPGSDRWFDILKRARKQRPQDIELGALAARHELRDDFWKNDHIPAEDFMKNASVPEKGVDTALLLDQAIEKVFPEGSSLYYYHGLSKALTPEGVSQVSIIQDMPGAEHLKLRIFKADGRVIIPAGITRARGRIQIDEVEVGDVVEDEYIAPVSAISPAFAGHLSPYIYRFADPERSFGLSEYQLIVPEDVPIVMDGFYEGLDQREDKIEGNRIFRFKAENMPPTPNEPFGPAEMDRLPWITYGFGLSWQDIGDSIREKMIPVLRSSPELDAFLREHLKGDTPSEAVSSFVRSLIEKVEAGNSSLDMGSTIGASFSAESGNRLGILAGSLIKAGHEVDLVLSRPAPLAGRHLKVPNMETFGIPLLRVHWGNEPIWIDLSEGLNGVGHISPTVQSSDGLIIPLAHASSPVEIIDHLPEFPNPMLEDRAAVHARVSEDGSAHIDFISWVTPPSAEALAQKLDSIPEEMMGPVFQRLTGRYFSGATEVEGRYEKLPDGRLIIRLSFDFPHACILNGDTMLCRGLITSEALSPILASLPERKSPLILQIPIIRINELSIETPEGFFVDAPKARLFESRWGRVKETIDLKGSVFSSKLSLDIPAVTIATEDYSDFARFTRAIDDLLLRPPKLRRNP